MNEEPIVLKKPMSRRLSWIIRGVVWSLVILLATVVTNCTVMVEVPARFLLGWWLHAAKTLPTALEKWEAFLMPSACLILAGCLIHRFVQRCLSTQGASRSLRPTDTLAALSLLLLGCGAAIALSGIVHQTVWLLSDPWIENRGRRAALTACTSDARQLMIALTEFYDEKGYYPNSLHELVTELNMPLKLAWVRYGTGKVQEPFVLLHPGEKRVMNANEPLIVSAVLQRDEKIVVGYGDSSVRSLPAKMLRTLIENRALTNSEMPTPP